MLACCGPRSTSSASSRVGKVLGATKSGSRVELLILVRVTQVIVDIIVVHSMWPQPFPFAISTQLLQLQVSQVHQPCWGLVGKVNLHIAI